MKLSEYIAKLQAILERDGDLDVVKQNTYGDMVAGSGSFSSVLTPLTADKFTYHGKEFVKSNDRPLPPGSELNGRVVKVD
ncbi:hypothetical protein FVF58_42790 [Paraburkholderia panacisoli]|uniref:Uncharacterized protein n=1 Tax=Paraburkholderia panacisoli TaxID=2603818 RepID=A0A5B0G666_9BURK|nr:hypothetical protein [Paraburkholderia panacisoli]KAA0999043.1 hypothetical protein FVF58_42790 [Paraburkholderia panacisoli]